MTELVADRRSSFRENRKQRWLRVAKHLTSTNKDWVLLINLLRLFFRTVW